MTIPDDRFELRVPLRAARVRDELPQLFPVGSLPQSDCIVQSPGLPQQRLPWVTRHLKFAYAEGVTVVRFNPAHNRSVVQMNRPQVLSREYNAFGVGNHRFRVTQGSTLRVQPWALKNPTPSA